jgi:NAD(P)-dependent dehydrogenase (short-subunit alcohol dehydrogenase family)
MGTVAVTGAASGIGAATRARLQAAGHRVIGIDVSDGDVVADLAGPVGRLAAIDAVISACDGRLDGLVTAAGVPPRFPAPDIVAVNYFGSVALLRGLRAALAAAGRARAVAVSSVFASTLPGVPMDVVDACLADDETRALELVASYDRRKHAQVYAATKVAVARWVRRNAWTPEWARAGIRLNAIAPGVTLTPFFPGVTDDDERQDRIPTGAAATPEQIAEWIVMMLGDAAEFMCGSVVSVDGGVDARQRSDDWPSPLVGPETDTTAATGLRRRWRRR